MGKLNKKPICNCKYRGCKYKIETNYKFSRY